MSWSFDASAYKEIHSIAINADVYTHPQHNALDHWLELFIARLTNGDDVNLMRSRMTQKQFEVVPSTQNYPEMLKAKPQYDQFIVLERGFYLLDKSGPSVVGLEAHSGQPDHHFRPAGGSHDEPIPLDFFKPSEQARINAYLKADYCLCQVCQAERARLGII